MNGFDIEMMEWKRFLKSGDLYAFDHALCMNREELDEVLKNGLGLNKNAFRALVESWKNKKDTYKLIKRDVEKVHQYLKKHHPKLIEKLENDGN